MLLRITRGCFEGQTVGSPFDSSLLGDKRDLTLEAIGCFLNVFEKEKIEPILKGFGNENDIDYIVVSDGEEVQFPVCDLVRVPY